VKTTEAYL